MMNKDATKLTYEHGDTLVFLVPIDVTEYEAGKLRDELMRKFPAADVLVLRGVADVKVLKRHD